MVVCLFLGRGKLLIGDGFSLSLCFGTVECEGDTPHRTNSQTIPVPNSSQARVRNGTLMGGGGGGGWGETVVVMILSMFVEVRELEAKEADRKARCTCTAVSSVLSAQSAMYLSLIHI